LNAGDEGVRAALEAAIKRSDELAEAIARLTPRPPFDPNARDIPAPMYGPPPSPGLLRRLFRRK
jgi:hypothetical protein